MSHSFQNKKLKRALMLIKQGRMNEAENMRIGLSQECVMMCMQTWGQFYNHGDKNNAIWFLKINRDESRK